MPQLRKEISRKLKRSISNVRGRKQMTPFLWAISVSEKRKEDESGKGNLEKRKKN